MHTNACNKSNEKRYYAFESDEWEVLSEEKEVRNDVIYYNHKNKINKSFKNMLLEF